MDPNSPSKTFRNKVNPKLQDQSSLQIYNLDEEIQKGVTENEEEVPRDPYSYSYLWFDISLLHPCKGKRDLRLKRYIQEKNKIEERLDVVDLIFAIETLKTSVENLKHNEITNLNANEKLDSHGLIKEPNKDTHFDFEKRKYNNLSNHYRDFSHCRI